MKSIRPLLLLSVLAAFVGAEAHAFPLPTRRMAAPPLRALNRDYNFEAIIRLNNCSGSLIRYTHSLDTDKAVILTNGHCLEGGMPSPGTYVMNETSRRVMEVLHPRTAETVGKLRATKIIYATMTKTDIALYQLDETYADIEKKFGMRPLVLAKVIASIGDEIEVISGYWRRGYACKVESFAETLREGGYVMEKSLRYSRPGCEIIGGTSGSPVIAAGTRTVVAINNTINENGLECEMNNPCEVDADGKVTAKKGYGYAQQTVQIYACLTKEGELDLNREKCRLPGGNLGPKKIRRIK